MSTIIPDYGFPMNQPTLGFPIPGPLVPIPRGAIKIATYPDGSNHPLATGRQESIIDPTVQYPTMGEEHGKDDSAKGILGMLSKGKSNPELVKKIQGLLGKQTKLATGYEPAKENRMWRVG